MIALFYSLKQKLINLESSESSEVKLLVAGKLKTIIFPLYQSSSESNASCRISGAPAPVVGSASVCDSFPHLLNSLDLGLQFVFSAVCLFPCAWSQWGM